jgi:hypothetical protein
MRGGMEEYWRGIPFEEQVKRPLHMKILHFSLNENIVAVWFRLIWIAAMIFTTVGSSQINPLLKKFLEMK